MSRANNAIWRNAPAHIATVILAGIFSLVATGCVSQRQPVLALPGKDATSLYYTQPFSYRRGNVSAFSMDVTVTCAQNQALYATVRWTLCIQNAGRSATAATTVSLAFESETFCLEPKRELYAEPSAKGGITMRFESTLNAGQTKRLLSLCAGTESLFVRIDSGDTDAIARIDAAALKKKLRAIALVLD